MKAGNLLGLGGSFLALASLVPPWWSMSIAAANYSYTFSCYAWGIKETGYIPGGPLGAATLPYPMNILVVLPAVLAILSALFGFIGSLWKPKFMGEAWPIPLILPVAYVGVFYMFTQETSVQNPLYGTVVEQYAPDITVTMTWGLQAGWYIIIIAGIFFLLAHIMMRRAK